MVMPDRAWCQALWAGPTAVRRALGINSDMTIVDLRCRGGWFVLPLTQLIGGKLLALAFDPPFQEAAHARVDRTWRWLPLHCRARMASSRLSAGMRLRARRLRSWVSRAGYQAEMRISPDAMRDIIERAVFTLDTLAKLAPYYYGVLFRRDNSGTEFAKPE